ncbi:39S ribosomal protein L13, mitochondrial [Contarinia nasturtii]|uniref:39S ribosomal protein L13, mitochondrial n=1 Tax=Contarinia nasturtii TaxID=265458 RepID=UPI0012D482C7|nr:39S ribosomal protein L13, mitochondrial [Contarinia nasturtii]
MTVLKKAQQWATFGRTWHLYDCLWQNPFYSAKIIATHLKGLHKPIYHPMSDCGDHVVVINTSKIALPGDEWTKRVYLHHTGYAGGATWTLAHELHEKDKTKVMWYAVYGAMKTNLQRRYTMQRVHLFPDANIPADMLANISNQLRQDRPVPKRIDEYDEETIKNFPKIMDYPEDYVVK